METNASGVLSNVSLVYGYDSLGRRTSVQSQVGGAQILSDSYAFDAASRLTNAADGPYQGGSQGEASGIQD